MIQQMPVAFEDWHLFLLAEYSMNMVLYDMKNKAAEKVFLPEK